MTLREEIDKARSEFQRTTDHIMTADDIERIIDRIDDIEELVINKEFDIVTRLSKIEDELETQAVAINILESRMDDIKFVTIGGTIKVGTPTEPPEPFLGYNELMNEALPLLKATIAEKKRELEHKVVPMKVSEE